MTTSQATWFDRWSAVIGGKPDNNRGTGRTYRQLEALEPAQTYVVHTSSMVPYARNILRRLGKQNHVVVFYGGDAERRRLAGLRLVIDHALWELTTLSPDDLEWLGVHGHG